MSTVQAPPAGSAGRARRAVIRAPRIRRPFATGVAASGAVLLAIAITVAVPTSKLIVIFALMFALTLILALVFVIPLHIGVAILAVYLGMFDGPVKLLAHNHYVSAGRDVLIGAVAAGALLRIAVRKEKVQLPPLSGWVLAFVALVMVEAFNPKTHGLLKVIGGYRQNLEWVPFFFFGYALIRTKRRFAQMFVIIGVIALANGVVSTYQTQISPAQLAAWGPGYSELVNGDVNAETGTGVTGRKYTVEGEGHVRPMGLGSDSGGGAGVGVIALPCALALLAFGGPKRKIYATVLVLGAIVAVITGLGRLQVVGAAIAIASFALLSASAGRKVTKPLSALLVVGAIALPLGAIFITAVGASIFSRYESIEPNKIAETSTSYKEQAIPMIPHYIESDPFGFGLGTVGPAVAFGGKASHVLEGHGVTAETQYNFTEDETGAPGLLLWLALSAEIIILIIRWLPKMPEIDIRIALAGVFAAFFAHLAMGLKGAFMDTTAAGSYFWFSFGIAAYWFAGPGRPQMARRKKRDARREVPA